MTKAAIVKVVAAITALIIRRSGNPKARMGREIAEAEDKLIGFAGPPEHHLDARQPLVTGATINK